MSAMPTLLFMGSPEEVALGMLMIPAPRAFSSLLRQDPLHERADLAVGHRRVGRHGDLTPRALAALFHLVHQLGFGAAVGAVLGGDVFVGRPDQLLVGGMAG